ncbi:MAG: starch-binding protein [Prevotella sp.]|nr:starch-binding protein [Prevotella sp.]
MTINSISHKAARLSAAFLLLLTALQTSAYTYDWDSRDDFRDETIYFVITTRFYDGDASNNTYCWDGTLNQQAHDPEWRGDFKGLIEKMDYIKALGFTAIWITPVVENASGLDYHGYHAFDFTKVDPRYESEDVDFQDVIDAAHSRGMKIILDIVLNHTGNFGEATLCPMFYKDYSQNLGEINSSLKVLPAGEGGLLDAAYGADNYLANENLQYNRRLALMKNTDGSNHDTHNYWHHYANFNWDDYSRWFAQIAGDCVDLNTENPVVADYLVSCYGKFIAMGVDGFRIDTSGHIARVTFNHAFIPKFQALAEQYKAKRNGGPFFMFGEVCARYSSVVYRGQKNMSPFYYTWKEGTNSESDYSWIDNSPDDTSWDNIYVAEGALGDQTNMNAAVSQGENQANESNLPASDNALLNGNTYHTPDYTNYSGFSVIDFPMHWNFDEASKAFNLHSDDKYYNDASYNVVYVDSHDYAPDNQQTVRFNYDASVWAENLDLMFTFRGIPCLYYGSEVQFKKGCVIDDGANTALINSGRAYYGGYITGDVTASEFGENYTATGNAAVSLKHPLSRHLQQLNKIRANVPALRRGQYSTDNISGSGIFFKRRYTSGNTDSFALVVISGTATFTGLPSATWVDVVTGDTQTGTTVKASTDGKQGNMRVYVMGGSKLVDDGPFIYNSSASNVDAGSYDGHQEDVDDDTELPSGSTGAVVEEPDEPIEPSMAEGEQAIFFDNSSSNWGGTIDAWVWNSSKNYTGGTWPGVACTYLGNKIWKWTYTGSDVVSGYCIFNNGSSQTADLVYVNGGMYNASGYQYTVDGAGEITGSTEDSGTATTTSYTVYFTDNYTPAWTAVYIYVWDNGNGNKEYLGSWPGTLMTQKDGQGRWTYTLTTTDTLVSPMVIFDDGNGGGISDQTADLTLVNYGVYNRDGLIEVLVPEEEEEEETGINAIKAAAGEDEWYTLTGVKIAHPTYRGVYIKNGRKVVIN